MINFNKKEALIGFLIVVLFLISIRFLTSSFEEGSCNVYAFFKSRSIHGIVSKKYIDSSQHSYPIIEITNSNDKIDTLNLVYDTSNIFYQISYNDTLIKKANEDVLTIKSIHGIISKKIDFGCKINFKIEPTTILK